MADNNDTLGIQATINGNDINKGAADFIRKLGEMESAADRVTSHMISGFKTLDEQIKSLTKSLEANRNQLESIFSKMTITPTASVSDESFRKLQEDYANCMKLQQQMEAEMSSLTEEFVKQREEYDKSKKKLRELTGAVEDAGEAFDEDLGDGTKKAGDQMERLREQMDSTGMSLKKIIGIIGGVAIFKQLIDNIVKVRGEFQSMEVAIETMIGKQLGEKIMAQLKEMATTSPLTLKDMVHGETTMLSFDIDPEESLKYLKALQDISMGSEEKFNSLTLAFSQISSQGKLMGQNLIQLINAGFNPLSVISQKTGQSMAELKEAMGQGAISAEMVQQAFMDATSAGGKFYNMSENASKTIEGQLSMMQDAIDSTLNDMGKATEGVIVNSIQSATTLIQNYEVIGKVLAGLVGTYGAYRTAIMLTTIAQGKHTLAEVALTNIRVIARRAQMALNASMLTNPYVALTVAIAGLVTMAWALHDSTTAAERAQKKLNEAQKQFNEQQEERRQRSESLINTIRSETETQYERIRAYEELKRLSPDLTNAYTLEELKILDLAEANTILNQSRDEGYYTMVKESIDETIAKIAELEKKQRNIGAGQGAMNQYNEYRKQIQDLNAELTIYTGKLEEADRIRKQAEFDNQPVEVRIASAKADREAILAEYLTAKMIIEEEQRKLSSQFDDVPIMVKVRFQMAQDDLNAIDQTIENLQNGQKSEVTNKSYWEGKKQQAETELSALSEIDAMGRKGQEIKKRIEGYNNKLQAYSLNTDRRDLKKEAEERIRQEQQRSDELLALRRKNQQAEIDLMQEGADKKYAQLKLDYEIQIEELRKQEKKWREAQNGQLTEDQQAELDFGSQMADSEKQRETDDYLKGILSKYQGYIDKRKAIDEKYENDRRRLQEAGANGEAYGELNYQKQEALNAIDLEFAQREDSFQAWATQVVNLSLDQLRELLFQAEQELQRMEFLNPEDSNISKTRAQITTLRTSINKKTSEEADGSPDKNSQKEWQELYRTLTKVDKQFAEIGNTIGGVAGEIISTAGSIASSTLMICDGIVTLVEMSAGSMEATATGAAAAISTIEKASVILAIISAALQIAMKIASLFGGADYESYNKAKENYESYVKVLDTVIDKQKELIETMTGKAAVEASQQALDLIRKQEEAARALGKERLNSGAGAGSHSIGYRQLNKYMSEDAWQEALASLGSASYNAIRQGRMEGLFDLSIEQLMKLQMEAPLFWAKLDDDVRDYLEQIIACGDAAEDMKNTLNETLTQVSFDSVLDDFLSVLSDMDASSQDFADNFEEYLQKAILRSMMVANYEQRIKDWYQRFANGMNDGFDQSDYDNLKAEWNDIVNDALAERDAMKDMFGWYGSTSQDSTKKGFQAMSQDMGEELNGRFTAVQESNEVIKEQSIMQTEFLSLISEDMSSVKREIEMRGTQISELLDIQYQSLEHLSEIRRSTAQLYQMNERLGKIESNTNKL